MSVKGSHNGFSENALVDLVVDCHRRGLFVRDPSPAVLKWQSGVPGIDDTDLEKRSHTDVPQLALSQLWSLMHGYSPRRKLDAGRRYLSRREIEVDLPGALRQHTEGEIERCFHKNRDFKVVQAGGLVWHVRRDVFRDAHQVVLEDPDAFLGPGPKLIKDSRTTTLARTPGDAILKRFNLKKVRNLVKYQFAPSRARRAFKRAYHLEMIGIRTPRVIAFADKNVLGSAVRSYLLMEFVPGVTEGATAFQRWDGSNDVLRHTVIGEAGRLIGLLHGAGFSNRDLKFTNLLVSQSGELWLIDLDGLQHLEQVNREVRLKNLRRIVRDLPHYGDVTTRDALHFLRWYTKALQRGSARDLFRKLSEEPWA